MSAHKPIEPHRQNSVQYQTQTKKASELTVQPSGMYLFVN